MADEPPHEACTSARGVLSQLVRLTNELVIEDANSDFAAAPVTALAEQMLALRGVIDRLEAGCARRLAPFDQRGACRSYGAASTASWLRHHAWMTGAAAAERVRIARQLAHLPDTAEAFATGRSGGATPGSATDSGDSPPDGVSDLEGEGLSYGQTAIIARAADDIGPEDAVAAEPTLLEAARRLRPDQLRTVTARLRHCLNPDGARKDAERAHQRRRLHISETMDGLVVLDGLFDPESGAIIRSALQAATPALNADDGRCAAQRRADALTEICGHVLDTGRLPERVGVRPHVTITADIATLFTHAGHSRPTDAPDAGCESSEHDSGPHGAGRGDPQGGHDGGRHERDIRHSDEHRGNNHSRDKDGDHRAGHHNHKEPEDGTHNGGSHHGSADADGSTAPRRDTTGGVQAPHLPGDGCRVPLDVAGQPGMPGAPPAHIENGRPIPAESVRRIACDATITRILLDADSQPLDVGRATRVVPSAIRRALDLRDGGCVYPGCDRPPSWCDAHHAIPWTDGGPTSLENLHLLCRPHHRMVHDERADRGSLANDITATDTPRPPGPG